ncbi:MAG: sugar phosphate isomerase/epimerase [Candidatus Omnitrophica bacterium]|nr:sugar phosphate isomerase/epimerase [Candidatus Omnitrophota bacterium]MCM8801904.1 sugar phosphate isomerase/epimerase [Candidatus Omnitrophota bacterium]
MIFTGISDEAGQAIETQIKAHKELGWEYMELRNVDKENLTMMSDEKFEEVYKKVTEAGMKVSCFSSCIANWATKISDDFKKDYDELKRAIPRMKKFNTKYIRVMSWPNDKDNPWDEERWAKEVIRRMKELVKMAEDNGIVIVHENCSGWGGESPENMVRLVEEMNSPNFKLMYDTGNVVAHNKNVNPWDFYIKVRPYIEYVHIKDYNKEGRATFPGEGNAMVKEILLDLKKSGYKGFVSIEPHLASVVHEGKVGDPEITYKTYITYGRKLMALLGS